LYFPTFSVKLCCTFYKTWLLLCNLCVSMKFFVQNTKDRDLFNQGLLRPLTGNTRV
jgi:hypothetical protein